MAQGFSLIIPAYNEEQTIGGVIREAFLVASRLSVPL